MGSGFLLKRYILIYTSFYLNKENLLFDKKIKKNLKNLAVLVDYFIKIAYTSASTSKPRVLKSRLKEKVMELSDRKKKILCMAVEEYIRDCSPITSGGIKDSASLDCSTATLRNELNALEAMGFLKQLHTSGGRIPTAQGYRFYVENLLENVSIDEDNLEKVKGVISARTNSLDDIVSGIAKIVSETTNYPTVVMLDGYQNLVLSEFKLIPLLEDKIMVLIGTTAGYITQTLDVKATQNDCEDASNYLTKHFKGETIGFMIENIDQLEYGMHGEINAFKNVVSTLIDGLRRMNEQKKLSVRREGSAKLLDSKGEIEEAKKVLNVLDDEKELSNILELEGKGNIEVSIADEDNASCSVVKAPICVNGRQLASIGVIGPQRMDYAGIASALKVVIDSLNDLKGE